MERRVFCVFCVMAVLGSVSSEASPQATPKLSIEKSNMTLMCAGGNFNPEPRPLTDDGASGHFTCCSEDEEPVCLKARVKILSAENLIQLDMSAMITVLVSDFLVTVLIGWAIYTVCAQPSTGTGYQDSKASDKKSLIPNERVSNNTPGDAYQRLNTRSDEYSTLQGQRNKKNNRHPISP